MATASSHIASTRFTLPAAQPLIMAIQVAPASDTWRGEIVVDPPRQAGAHHRQGRPEGRKRASPGQPVLTSAPATMAAIPKATRRSEFSPKTNHANNAVNTPSALSKSDAPDAGIPVSPNISSTGPTTPPATIAPSATPIHSAVASAPARGAVDDTASAPSDPR